MIAALEKQKYVYILNRDNEANLTISSPLEAHKSHMLTYDICGVDIGFDNPLFVAIESDYGDIEDHNSAMYTGEVNKLLVYYEMDLGLNHVVRKLFEPIPHTAHMLISGNFFKIFKNYFKFMVHLMALEEL